MGKQHSRNHDEQDDQDYIQEDTYPDNEGYEDDYQDGYDEDLTLPALPAHGIRTVFISGITTGLLLTAISVILTLLNAATYNQAAQLNNAMPYSMAIFLLQLSCISYSVAIIASFTVGFIVGKTAVQRMKGFYAGALTGFVTYICGVIVQYIPNYPGHIGMKTASTPGEIAGGLLVLLISIIIWAVIGGLFGLWGSYTATRKHPYYQTKLRLAELESN